MDTSFAWLKFDALHNFDTDLQIFYQEVIAKELDIFTDHNSVTGIKQALKEVVNAYKKDTVESHSSSIQFDTPQKRCAYVLKHCPCFTSAVARHFLQMLRAYPIILNKALDCRKINLCCLGGGPATDAVAVIKIINVITNAIVVRKKQKLQLRVWIVDLNEEWRHTAKLVFQTLTERREFCESANIALSLEFVQADLTAPWNERLSGILKEADIVTMVYFLSAVNGSKDGNKSHSMLKNIMDSLRPEAALFFVDSSKEIHYNAIDSAASSDRNLKQVYGPFEQTFHTLSIKSIKKYIELYYPKFNPVMCLTNCFVTSCGWVKERHMFVREPLGSRMFLRIVSSGLCFDESTQCNISKKTRRWHKTVAHNTKMQQNFRERVEKLLLSELHMNFATDDWDDADSEPECLVSDAKMLFASKAKIKRIFV